MVPIPNPTLRGFQKPHAGPQDTFILALKGTRTSGDPLRPLPEEGSPPQRDQVFLPDLWPPL